MDLSHAQQAHGKPFPDEIDPICGGYMLNVVKHTANKIMVSCGVARASDSHNLTFEVISVSLPMKWKNSSTGRDFGNIVLRAASVPGAKSLATWTNMWGRACASASVIMVLHTLSLCRECLPLNPFQNSARSFASSSVKSGVLSLSSCQQLARDNASFTFENLHFGVKTPAESETQGHRGAPQGHVILLELQCRYHITVSWTRFHK